MSKLERPSCRLAGTRLQVCKCSIFNHLVLHSTASCRVAAVKLATVAKNLMFSVQLQSCRDLPPKGGIFGLQLAGRIPPGARGLCNLTKSRFQRTATA